MSDKKEEKKDGKWVTINGNHIFIKDGQTVEEAMKDFFARNNSPKKVVENNKKAVNKIEEDNKTISISKEFFKLQNETYEEEYLQALDILLKKGKLINIRKEAEEALRSIGHVPNYDDIEKVTQWYNIVQNVKNKINKNTNERLGHYGREEKIIAVAIDSNSSMEMSEQIVDAITKYTAGESYDQFKNGQMAYEEKIINEYVKNAPKFKGEIYRGLSLKNSNINDFLEEYNEGNEIELEHIKSFTASRHQAYQFANQQEIPVILTVSQNKNGVMIKHLSDLYDEEEVLHPIGSKFKITKVIKPRENEKTYRIFMEEIENE